MVASTTYDREIKKAYVNENGYQIASYDFNSCEFKGEIDMIESKADECFELMDQARIDDEYFVSTED